MPTGNDLPDHQRVELIRQTLIPPAFHALIRQRGQMLEELGKDPRDELAPRQLLDAMPPTSSIHDVWAAALESEHPALIVTVHTALHCFAAELETSGGHAGDLPDPDADVLRLALAKLVLWLNER